MCEQGSSPKIPKLSDLTLDFDCLTLKEKHDFLMYVFNTYTEKVIIKALNNSLFRDTSFKLKARKVINGYVQKQTK